MDKSKDRLEQITKNLKSLGLKFNRFSAVNGKELKESEIDKLATPLCTNLLCNPGIIGCAQSHKEIWKKLVKDDKTEYYLILEDDATLSKESVEIIKKLEPRITKHSIDFINLSCIHTGCGFVKTEFKIDDYEFGKPIFPLCLTGYIITKKGAQKILDDLEKTNYHIDFEISLNRIKGNFNYYASNKPVVRSSDDATTIGNVNNTITCKILDFVGFKYCAWVLTNPIFTIKMQYTINLMLLLLIALLIINYKFIKSKILFWFVILEVILFHTSYFTILNFYK
jgi:GR25 family glycosyltransferase involved in LPS biosynthesis